MSDNPESRAADDLGRLIEVLARQAEAASRTADLIESRALPLLERIAIALERAPATAMAPVADGPVRGLVEFRRAIDQGLWDHADALARELALARPGNPEVAAMAEELARSRQSTIDDLRGRIEAARLANDPEGAIRSRDDLAGVLHGEAIKELDRSLVKWLMGLIQRRMRTGTIRADVVVLAGRVADSFGGTVEGASLRASLPTLRRSAGLCPRCAEPYAGVGDACPKCLATSSTATPIAAATPDEAAPDEDPDDREVREPIDLNDEQLWRAS